MTYFVANLAFEIEHCCRCGMAFALSRDFQQKRRNDHKLFYCPDGHSQYYSGESKAERLQRELDQQIARTNRAESNVTAARHERDQIAKAHRKMRKRVMNGVCPCCNRSFENLRNHMSTQHPDFGQDKTLRALREAFGMTQADVAKEAFVKPLYVSHYERGRPMPADARDSLTWWMESQSERRRA